MRTFASILIVLMLPILTALSALACDVPPDDPTPVPSVGQTDSGGQSATQFESVKQVDQPTPVVTPTVKARGMQAAASPSPKSPTAAEQPQRSPVQPQADTPMMDLSGIPGGSTWVLESVGGSPLIDETFASVTIRGDSYGGFDGCNSFGGRHDDGAPVATEDGTFSAPGAFRTQMLCEKPEGTMEQADALVDALMQGESFRLEGDRMEIVDESGEVRLVLIRQESLPGHPVDLVGTAWRLVVEDDEDSTIHAPTLAFLNEHVATGVAACRGYVADYSVSDGYVRFPSLGMTGPTESCARELIIAEGDYTDHLTWTADYSMDDSSGKSLLRVRTRRGETLIFEPLLQDIDSVFDGRWSLTTLVEAKDMGEGHIRYSRYTDVIPGTEVTIEFSENGVSGSAGCNSYNAPVEEAERGAITIGAASVTRAWCDAPERLMEQERRYLDILSRVSRYRIYGDRLSLLTDDDDALLFVSHVHSLLESGESESTATPTLAPAPTSTSAPVSATPTPAVSEALLQDARHYAADVGVDLDEAVRRLQAQRTIGELGAELEANEQPTFGGLWIQHKPEFKVVVAFTRDGEETVRPYIQGTSLADMVEVREVEATLVELREAQREAGAILRQLGIRAASGIDITRNVVQLYLSEKDKEELDEALKKSGLELSDKVEIVI